MILVSNDSDYAPVLEQLRAQGVQTICIGPQGLMSPDLILHSDDFYYADDLKQRPAAQPSPKGSLFAERSDGEACDPARGAAA